ncbi:Aste57867_3512 [Aphanomyces stellatus]|uniref:Aste57867_3512 protein n=1 Tax=Aphanomyces stellatus TaxID=120398 RepID=A0A485KAP3_9STRA|nr:hypothetical protein As57867_003501 [Aphanomyces stellatus]VFT80675.1 Aste57867_3512 [Aphanomyces stellatus]
MAFLTVEDLKLSFNLFCVVYGAGTLGMPGNYARAGFTWATLALLLMAAINIYTTSRISKVLLVAPKTVKTYGDLGEWCFGKVGRYVTVVTQLLVCWMVPIAFLVLSGSLLTTLFPGAFEATTWIILLGLAVMPVCLMPSLKESAGVAAAGAFGTLFADIVAIYVLVSKMHDAGQGLSLPTPQITFNGVTSVFGNLSLGYSAGVVIPALQREHSDPSRMPRVIVFTLGVCSVLFLIVSITGSSTVGCQIPGNLLFAIEGDKLGFTPPRGGIVLAFLAMQLHCAVAFAVILFPTFYIMERVVFGFHKVQNADAVVDEAVYNALDTPAAVVTDDDATKIDVAAVESVESVAHYHSFTDYLKAMVLRLVMVTCCIVLAIVWKDQFMDILDFVGASSTAMTSMILPTLFYLKTFGKTINAAEKAWCIFTLVVCAFLGIYVSYYTGKALFTPTPTDPTIKFPYCAVEYQKMVFTNRTYYNLPPL